jgi:hypothetical protein
MSVYPFIEAEKVEHRNVTQACELMEVSRLSLAMAKSPVVAEVVPEFGQVCPHRWPMKFPPRV